MRGPFIVPPMTTHNQVLGFRGERIAERWLERKGWRVLQRRFRDGHRDLDLIAERQGTVAFVEVKARSATRSARRSRLWTGASAASWSGRRGCG